MGKSRKRRQAARASQAAQPTAPAATSGPATLAPRPEAPPPWPAAKPPWPWLNSRALITYFTLAALLLLCIGLGNNDYWDDEANTAAIGRNLLNSGTLSAWDGHNLISYGLRGQLDDNLEKRGHPPLQYLIAALSLHLFGDSPAGGRLLFVLIGFLSIPLAAAWYAREFDGKSPWVVACVLALSVAYLLYLKQVRYYPLGLTFAFGSLWMWALLPTAKRAWLPIAGGLLFTALLMLSQYLYAAATLAVIACSLLRARYRCRASFIYLGALGALGLVALVLLFYFNPETLQKAATGEGIPRVEKTFKVMLLLFRDISRVEFIPLGMFAFTVFAWWQLQGARQRARRAQNKNTRKIKNSPSDEVQRDIYAHKLARALGYMLVVALVISFLSPQKQLFEAEMRYYVLLIPLGAVVAALTFEMLRATRFKYMGAVFLVVLLSSNILSFNFLGYVGVHARPLQYMHEALVDYTTGSEAISDYLTTHVPKDKCVFIVPMYTIISQLYHRPEHTYCSVVSEHASFVANNRHRLRESLFYERVVPDYVIVGGWPHKHFQPMLNLFYGNGTYSLATALPVDWANRTRPEIPDRVFGAVSLANPQAHIPPPEKGGVLVYTRTATPASAPRLPAFFAHQMFFHKTVPGKFGRIFARICSVDKVRPLAVQAGIDCAKYLKVPVNN